MVGFAAVLAAVAKRSPSIICFPAHISHVVLGGCNEGLFRGRVFYCRLQL